MRFWGSTSRTLAAVGLDIFIRFDFRSRRSKLDNFDKTIPFMLLMNIKVVFDNRKVNGKWDKFWKVTSLTIFFLFGTLNASGK